MILFSADESLPLLTQESCDNLLIQFDLKHT